MKKILVIPIVMLLWYNSSWSQCPATVTISGIYTTLNTGSNSWIASNGVTTIPTGSVVTLDANPLTNGYVLLNTGFETQPNSTFSAIVLTPCALLANETFTESKSFLVYPNPLTALLNIESSSVINSISITDLNGRTIFENKNNSASMTVNTDGFSSGIYVLKITTENGSSLQKIVKN